MARLRSGSGFSLLGYLTLFAFVAVVGIVVVAFGLVRDASLPFTGPGREADLVFPELHEQIENVTTVTIEVDDERLIFRRGGNGEWVIAEKDGYPAISPRVDALLAEFKWMPGLERMEAEREQLAELGVPDQEADEAGRRVHLLDADENLLKSFIIGNRRSAPGATDLRAFYVREAGSNVVWLADADLEVSVDPMDWVNNEILWIPREIIAEVYTAPPNGNPVHIRRTTPEEGAFTGVNLPEDMEIEGPWVLAELIVPFTAMTFDDVAAAPEALEPGEEGLGYVRSFDGVRLWYAVDEAGEEEHWVRFAVEEVAPAPGWEFGEEGARADEGAEVADVEDPIEDIREPVLSAAELRERLEPWTFRVPDFTAERLRRSIDELPTIGGVRAGTFEPEAVPEEDM